MLVRDFLDDVIRSIGFLSRLTMPQRFFDGYDGSLSRTVQAFPVAGVVIVLPSALAFSVLLWGGTSPLLAGFIALAIQTVTTGALHDDGLGDTADGLGGGRDRQAALAIMKDSRIGTYGAVALILSFGLRASALAALGLAMAPTQTFFALLGIAALSRGLMVWYWSLLGPARSDGVAASVGAPDTSAVRVAQITGALILILVTGGASGFTMAVLTGSTAALAVWAFTHYVDRRLGGHTGDTIGAAQQIGEIMALSALAVLY